MTKPRGQQHWGWGRAYVTGIQQNGPPLTHSVDVLGSCSWFRDASRPLLGGLGLAEINGLGYITANL